MLILYAVVIEAKFIDLSVNKSQTLSKSFDLLARQVCIMKGIEGAFK